MLYLIGDVAVADAIAVTVDDLHLSVSLGVVVEVEGQGEVELLVFEVVAAPRVELEIAVVVEVVLGTKLQFIGKAVGATVADILRVHNGIQPHVCFLRLVAYAGDESVADGILQDVLHEVELSRYCVFHHSRVGLVALFKFSQDMLFLARQRDRADGVHQRQVEHILD